MEFIKKRPFVVVLLFLSISCDSQRIWESTPQIRSAAFAQYDVAWLATERNGLLYTVDGGQNWSNLSTRSASGYEAITFISERRGWAVSASGEVLSTDNAGRTWKTLGTLQNPNASFHRAEDMYFSDDTHGVILESLSVWYTEDGGKSWYLSSTREGKNKFRGSPVKASFVGTASGWLCTSDGFVYKTDDKGRNWLAPTLVAKANCRNIFFLDEKTGWITAWPDGGIYRTDDGGNTWHRQDFEAGTAGIDSIYFLDKNEGWAAGEIWPSDIGKSSTKGLVLHTNDGGAHWQPLEVGPGETFFDRILFVNQSKGWLISRDNVYRTTDAGKSWQIVLRLPPHSNS